MTDLQHWKASLQHDLDERRRDGHLRLTRVVPSCDKWLLRNNQRVINFSSNDYLALAQHPAIIEAVQNAVGQYGAGAGASRLISGSLAMTEAFEKDFAAFKHAESCLLLPTGYMANHAVLTCLADKRDLILLDKLSHASLIDGARASGAVIRTFAHRDMTRLETLLKREQLGGVKIRRRIIVTDSVFSMDGDVADLIRLVQLRDAYHAILVVDEAHGTGVMGKTGAGLAEAQGVSGKVDVTISTGGKAMGSLGGMVSGDQVIIDSLINHARSAIYTTAVPPAQVAALNEAMRIIRIEPERRVSLKQVSLHLRMLLHDAGLIADEMVSPVNVSPIVPIIIGDPIQVVSLSEALQERGWYAPAIRYPTVARGADRLRVSLRSDITMEEIEQFVLDLLELKEHECS